MDSSDVGDFGIGLIGTLAVTGIAFAGLKAFSDMSENYSKPRQSGKKRAKRSDIWDYDLGFKDYW